MVAALAAGLSAQSTEDPPAERELFKLINRERVAAGLAAYTWDERLAAAARIHNERMAQRDELSHQFEGEDALLLRLHAQNVRSDHDGENIALNSDVTKAHEELMQSPLHRANILNPQFNAVGIAVIRNGDLAYITEDFAHALPDYSDFEADAVVEQAISDFARSRSLPPPKRKTRTQLVQMACDMAKHDKIDPKAGRNIAGVTSAVAWTATDLRKLPEGLKALVSQPTTEQYSFGVCFATSADHPGGVYWLLFVAY